MSRLSQLIALLVLATCTVLCGQRFDLGSERLPVASIDGLWRFHPGDDPAWAKPAFDDSQWSLLHSDADWGSQGFKTLTGLAWYRFSVVIPAGVNDVSLMLPPLMTTYEVYADGALIGTFGKMPPNRAPYGGPGPYSVYRIPTLEAQKQQRIVVIALRLWHWPGWSNTYGGGPEAGGGLVGDTSLLERRSLLEKTHQLFMYADVAALALLSLVAGFVSMALYISRRKETEYLWFGFYMILQGMACSWRLYGASHVLNLEFRDLVDGLIVGASFCVQLAFYSQLFHPRRTWLFKLAVCAIALHFLDVLYAGVSANGSGLWFDTVIQLVSFIAVDAWIIQTVLSAARRKSPDARLLAVPVLSFLCFVIYGEVAWATYVAGWQHTVSGQIVYLTHSPFPITLDDLLSTCFLLAAFGILILRFARTRAEQERVAKELQSAREVQQYLIPAHIPATPGLRIESEYRPAREVGGDFFQVLPNPETGSVLVVLGDVAGKGLEAGMLATLIVGAIRTAAVFTADPSRIMTLLNERLQGRGLVTCIALRIDQDGSAILVNAGHLAPYLNGSELPMEGALPLGAILGIDFPALHFQLAPGDSLTLMSDGIVEATDAQGQLFGFDRIGALLRDRATAATLANAAQQFGQEDDITVLAMARLATAV